MSLGRSVIVYHCRRTRTGPITKTCAECGEEFPTHDRRTKFCDRRCMAKHRTGAEAKALEGVIRVCQNQMCQESFVPRRYRQVYCSGPCQQEQLEAERNQRAKVLYIAPKRLPGYLIAPQGVPTCSACGAHALIGTDFLGRSVLDCARGHRSLMPIHRKAN